MKVKKLNNSSEWSLPSRTGIGVTISVLYAGLLISLVIWRWTDLAKLDLNELGDFAAGAFGPMAILWLVLGYFQQGDELKQNTDALKQQAEELKQSAAHQAALVEATREQVNSEMERYREEKRRQKIKIQPRFSISWKPDPYVGNNRGEINIINLGNECMDPMTDCVDAENGIALETYGQHPILRRNESIKGALVTRGFDNLDSVSITIYYNDSDDEGHSQTYEGTIYGEGKQATLIFEGYSEMVDRSRFHDLLTKGMQ